MDKWVIIAFIAGFALSFLIVFFLGFWLGRRSKKPVDRYKLLQSSSPGFSVSSATIRNDITRDQEPSQIPKIPIERTEPVAEKEELLHQRLGQLDLSSTTIVRTPEFDQALKMMDDSHNCVFVTGEAGTGKSTLLKYFVTNTKKKVVILSPTGVAAINIGGQTIHSFFKFPPRAITAADITHQHGEVFQALDAIIIDEISMVRADLMDAIDESLRVNRDCQNQPFGGAQIIMFGDLFQLPPVVSKAEEGQFFSQYYRSPYFFDAHVFGTVDIHLIKLKTIFRQKDQKFIELLNHVRIKRINNEMLNALNQRVDPEFEPNNDEGYIILTAKNDRADIKNAHELDKIPLPVRIYEGNIEGNFDATFYPTDLRLRLKIGAQVMMLTNDVGKRWFNGTVGIVEELGDEIVKVKIPKPAGQPPQMCEVGRYTWQVPQYSIDHTTRTLQSNIVGTFTQFPLKLAWAITIHKSQGKTLDRVILDLTGGAFAHGQTYVALSRCTSLDGLVLKKKIQQRDIIVDERVFGFFDRIQERTI